MYIIIVPEFATAVQNPDKTVKCQDKNAPSVIHCPTNSEMSIYCTVRTCLYTLQKTVASNYVHNAYTYVRMYCTYTHVLVQVYVHTSFITVILHGVHCTCVHAYIRIHKMYVHTCTYTYRIHMYIIIIHN